MPARLGQHFLRNNSAIKKIIAVLDIRPGETIIEIGPGRGALTFPLAEECIQKNCHLIAIEKDSLLARNLESKIMSSSHPLCHSALDAESRNLDPRVSPPTGGLPEDDNYIQIITGDALKTLPEIVRNLKLTNLQTYKLIGNIPYYITGKLLRIISELKNKPSISVLMVQREVAERIYARPKGMNPVRSRTPQGARSTAFGRAASNGMNLLAAATQYWAKPEIILNLKAKEFDPPPEVDSAVIKLTTKSDNKYPLLSLRVPPKQSRFNKIATSWTPRNDGTKNSNHTQNAENYYKLIHIIFKQPRKTLANNLKDGLNISRTEIEKILNSLNLPLNSRPQDISVEQILKITSFL